MIIRHVRPWTPGAAGAPSDIHVEGGRIAAIRPSAAEGPALLALPGLVEGHCHLDKTLWGRPWWRNEVGPGLRDRIANEKAVRRRIGLDPRVSGRALAEAHLRAGTTRLRTHCDVDEETGLRHVEATLALRQDLAGRVEVQVVAFPQSGILHVPGVRDALEEALRLGCDAVGGLDPSLIDRDPVRHLDAVFALAERHAKPVDIHLHEAGEMGAFSLELIAERTRALGMAGRVTVSHGFALGDLDGARADALWGLLAGAGVMLCTSAPPSRAVPSLRRARASGVRLFAGNDNIRDTWNPMGVPDMRHRASLVAMKNELRRDDEVEWALEAVSTEAAAACGFGEYGLAPGCRADLVLLDAEGAAEAVAGRAPPVRVISHGREVDLSSR